MSKPTGRKFEQHNERVREHMQWAFCYGISVAARDWLRAGKPESEWSELYEHVLANRDG